jgi:multiple sugar transport system permease protein
LAGPDQHFYFTFVGVPVTVAVSLLAAVALNQKFVKTENPCFRMSFFAPVVTTVVAVAVVWRWLYNPDYGVFNWFLQSGLGVKKLFWLSDPRTSLPSLMLMAVWKNFGYNMVIFLAGLQTIPESQYEAARIDGASGWQCFRYITIPGTGAHAPFRVHHDHHRLLPIFRGTLRNDERRAVGFHHLHRALHVQPRVPVL